MNLPNNPLVASLVTFALALAPVAAAEETEAVPVGPVTFGFPKTWVKQKPTNNMRVMQYGVPLADDDKGKAKPIEFVVFHFPGSGGSAEDNMKRWIGEFSQVDEKEKIETQKVGDLTITTLDVSGTFKEKPFPMAQNFTPRENYRSLAAVVEIPGSAPYFFKMVGPKKSMAAQEENWKALIKSAKKGG